MPSTFRSRLWKTSQRLVEAGLTNARLHLTGHEHLDEFVKEPIRAAIFNLGYLPLVDKSIITQPETTLIAIENIDRLKWRPPPS